MKVMAGIVLLLASSTVALGKPAPVEQTLLTLVRADINISNSSSVGAMRENIGTVGAMRERHYFGAPQPQFNPRVFPCRLEPLLFDKTRLAQSCR
jgi:hypothetical protein